MRVGLQVPNLTWPNGQAELGDTFGLIAERAERAGFYSFWVMDHFFQIRGVGPAEHEMLEGWSALAFAAGKTNHIRLGTMVTGVTYRYPGLLVKTATTLDVLSHGRAYFGIGAAWNEEEHNGLGVPFPPIGERFERLEETLQIALQMWSGDEKPFEGKHYQLGTHAQFADTVQRPHPPILIGGGGEQKTLRLVAQYADACNLFAALNDTQHEACATSWTCCASTARHWAGPTTQSRRRRSVRLHLTRDGGDGTMTPAAAVERLQTLASVGFDQAHLQHGRMSASPTSSTCWRTRSSRRLRRSRLRDAKRRQDEVRCDATRGI